MILMVLTTGFIFFSGDEISKTVGLILLSSTLIIYRFILPYFVGYKPIEKSKQNE